MEKKLIYPAGMSVFMPRAGAPDFVVADISIQPQKFLAFLKENGEYLSDKGYFKFNMKRGTDGTYYLALDTYKPGGVASAPAEAPKHDRTPVEGRTYASAMPSVGYPADDINPEDVPF